MEHRYSWSWIEAQVALAAESWNGCAGRLLPAGPRSSLDEQRKRERAYDQALRAVEREARRAPRTSTERLLAQQRIVDAFPRFAAIALDLEPQAVELLTGSFLPVGSQLARQARGFDRTLSMDDIIQACRNAWTACGLQALLGQPMELTPPIFAYSLLYPYSDNCLDDPELSGVEKLRFSDRFRQRLSGLGPSACNAREAAVWAMVQTIEAQYPRPAYPQVYDCLLAIHRAQEESMAQLGNGGRWDNSPDRHLDDSELERISCAKGGTSVLANACLVLPWLSPEESQFAIDWGVLLQLGDDLQDLREDLRRGSVTLFTRAAAHGEFLDSLVLQLLNFSRHVGDCMDRLPNGAVVLKDLLRMSWRSLILMAVANARQFFSPAFLSELEPSSPFRFDFLRARNEKLAGRQALYAVLFDAFLEAGPGGQSELPLPLLDADRPAAAGLCSLSSSYA
ncbi:MAG: hypothetical protein ABR898_00180 [Terracidiphilus sp.]|jgi:hypothetical protein